MNTPAKAIRITKATTVIKLAHEGMSIVKACKEARIARSSFYDICKKEPEVLASFQELIRTTNFEQLALILGKRDKVLKKLLETALSDETKPLERLNIFVKVEKQLDTLFKDLRLEGGNDEAAAEILSGPTLVPAVSRFTVDE